MSCLLEIPAFLGSPLSSIKNEFYLKGKSLKVLVTGPVSKLGEIISATCGAHALQSLTFPSGY